jgi:hypothetical protein
VREAKSLEALFAHEEERGSVNCGHRGGVIAAVEYRKFSHRGTWPLNIKDLFASTGRALEDADMSGLHDVQPSARLSLGKDGLTSSKVA